MYLSPVLLHKGDSRSTFSQHMLTKCFKNIIWVIMMSNLNYYPLTMSRTTYMMIEWSMMCRNRVFKCILSYCDFGQKRLFFVVNFFSKNDFGFQNGWNIIPMFQKCFFNLFKVSALFPNIFGQKLVILDSWVGDPP